MALNQIWISANGTDTNSGTTYALAKKTLGGGISTWTTAATTTYNVLNIANDGTHAMANASEILNGGNCSIDIDDGFVGTSYSGTNFGFVIQGVDSSGSPALATLASTRTRFSGMCNLEGNGNSLFMKYATIKGIVFDFTVSATKATPMHCIYQYSSGACPIRVQDCWVIGSGIGGVTPYGERRLLEALTADATAATVEGYEVSYNVFVNASGAERNANNNNQKRDSHHNIFIWNTNDSSATNPFGYVSGPTFAFDDYSMTHTTFYVDTGVSTAAIPTQVTISSTNVTNIDIHSNLLFLQPASNVPATAPLVGGVFNGGGSNGTVQGTMGYNLFALGTNISQLASWTSGGFYDDSYLHPEWPTVVTTFTTTFSSDIVTTNTALADTFNETTTSWTWTDASGNGYSHNLPFDMRPIVGRTDSFTGGVIGAIAQDIVIPVPPGPGGGIEFDAVLDSLPFYRPVFKADVVAMVRVSRNDTFSHIDMRHYLKADQFDESTHRIVEVAPAARYVGSLAGVGSATSFMLETDVTVNLTVVWVNGATDTNFGMTVSEVAAFDQAGIKSFIINNTSSATATVQIIAFQ